MEKNNAKGYKRLMVFCYTAYSAHSQNETNNKKENYAAFYCE